MPFHKSRYVLVTLLATLAIGVGSCSSSSPAEPPSRTGATSGDVIIVATADQDEDRAVETDGILLPAEDPPNRLLGSSWSTDFSRRTVEWSEILSGGPPKDGIPAVDNPSYETVSDAGQWLTDRDPVILFEHGGVARAYPLAILIWHEIVNDVVGGLPVSVTFCPLCNASIVFARNFQGQVLDFGTTGLLRNSDLVMYDRQTETWWQQFLGQGIAGKYAGEQLTLLPSQVISFSDFRLAYPAGDVLARPGATRQYGTNPYTNYDSTTGRPFLYTGELDERLPSTERVAGVVVGGEAMAYPFDVLEEHKVINDEIGGTPIVIFHKGGTASALDTGDISEGRDVGSTVVFERTVGDDVLTFEAESDGLFRDTETGTLWSFFGEAVEGDLAGTQLNQVMAFDHFWFAWSAFHADTGLYDK